MPQISFEADTQDELIAMVRRWVAGLDAVDSAASRARRAPRGLAHPRGAGVLHRLKGVDSRRLVHEVAEAAMRGEAVPFDDALRARYGKTNGTAFAGMVSGPNKLMRRIAKRDLITWDARSRGLPHRPGGCRDHPGELGLRGVPESVRRCGARLGH